MANMKNGLIFGIVFLTLIFSISLISAQENVTLITGKVYDADFTEKIVDVALTIKCNGLTTSATSGVDGSYYAFFNDTECPLGFSVEITGAKGDLSGTTFPFGINPEVYACNGSSECVAKSSDGDVTIKYFAVGNIRMVVVEPPTSTPSSSGSSGGSGGSSYTITRVNNTNQTIANTEVPENVSGNETSIPENTQDQGFFSRITGAVIGAGAPAQVGLIVLIIALLIGSYFAVKYFGSKNSKVSN